MSLTRLVARCLYFLLVALALGGSADDARADATQAHLVWSEPDAGVCASAVTAQSLEGEVEQLVGHPVFIAERAQADVVLRGGIDAAPTGVRAWFEARDVSGVVVGNRALIDESGDCASLQHSAALVLSVLLDHPRGAAEPPAEARKGGVRSVSGSAGIAGWYGPLPRLAPGLWLSLELGLSVWLRVRVDGGYWLPSDEETHARGAKMSALTGGLALCPSWSPTSRSRFALGACLGGQLGGILAAPMALEGPDLVARLLAHVTLELGASVRIRRLATLFVAAGPAVALTRPRFFYTREDARIDVFQPRTYGMIARVGLTIGAL